MNSKYSRSYYRCELIGVGVGAAAGGLLAPPESRRLGLALGAIIGGLLAIAWKFWILKHQRSEGNFSIAWFGHLFYLLAIVLCVYMLWIAVRTFLFDPDKMVVALLACCFLGRVR